MTVIGASPEGRLGGEVLGRVRLHAAGLALVVEGRGVERHEVGRLEFGPVLRQRMLDALVLADRPAEDDALARIGCGPAQRAAPESDQPRSEMSIRSALRP